MKIKQKRKKNYSKIFGTEKNDGFQEIEPQKDSNDIGRKAYDMSYKEQELLEISRNVILCLGHISENYYFGISVLISVLRGGNRKQINKHEL